MADDSMEISSEHGHDGDDGDIDIDFDFTSPQVDEDFVLEDAALNTDFGQNFQSQPSPVLGNDELMIDEDVDSYPMDDADLLHDENGHIMEHEVVPFATEDSLHLGEDQTERTQFGSDESAAAADYTYLHQEALELEAVEKDAAQENYGSGPHHEDLNSTESAAVPDNEKLSTEQTQHDSRTVSPLHGGPQSVISAQAPRSPPASSPERGQTSPDHKAIKPETNISSPSLSGDAGKVEAITSSDGIIIVPPPRDVIVIYRSVEYALFSSSELDDPDSFFLSDKLIAEKPLADLFKAIREVIQEDLTGEDELCMAVEDLGIETEERSSTLLHDITLTQILSLREKLLRNDGVDSIQPMCLILNTRTNFSKRLENLTAGAAEGKGLSQLIAWDEHSESLDDLAEADESKNNVQSTLKGRELDSVPGAEEEVDQAAHGTDTSEPEESAPEPEHELEPEPINDTKLGTNESVSASEAGLVQEYTAIEAKTTTLQAAKQNGKSPTEDYGEDDLIDYSEEEGDNIPAVQRHVKSNSTDESRLNHEYEAINEDLRRRSISRTAEDRAFEQSDEQPPTTSEGDYDESYVEENGIELETKNEHQEEFENGSLNAVHEDLTAGEFEVVDSLEHYDEAGLLAAELGREGQLAEPGVIVDSYDIFGTEAQDYNYGDEDALEDDNTDSYSLQRDEASVGNGPNLIQGSRNSPSGADMTEDNLEQADTAESSVTVGADEIQYEDEPDGEVFDNAETTAEYQALNDETGHFVVEHQDEIDYEDDEDEDGREKNTEATTPLTASPVLPISNGKRSRADIELDDHMNMGSQVAKRPRS